MVTKTAKLSGKKKPVQHKNKMAAGKGKMAASKEKVKPVEAKAMTPQREVAIRAWNLIRQKIEEVAAETKHLKVTSFNWTFLSQHIAHMADQQKARDDLYDKYIHNPHRWADGLVNFPHHLFSRARLKAIKNDYMRPHTYCLPSSSRKVTLEKRSQSCAMQS